MAGTTTQIQWSWGTSTTLNFNPTSDILDFGWFAATHFTVSDTASGVLIDITSNQQSYLLSNVTLSELSVANIMAKDATALEAWTAVLGTADMSPPTDTGDASPPADQNDSPTPPDDGEDASPPATSVLPWSATAIYTGGELVQVGDTVFRAGWWTRGEDPAVVNGPPGSGKVWTVVGQGAEPPADPSPGPNPTPDPLPDPLPDQGTGPQPGAPSSSGKFFSPYIDMQLSSSQAVLDLVDQAGLNAITLAFMLSSGQDQMGWGGYGDVVNATLYNGTPYADVIGQLQAKGVETTVSFGGAFGVEPALAYSSAEALMVGYRSVVDTYGVKSLDFDIEGAAIANTAANAMRSEALASLQAADPSVEVSFTLPVLPVGLTIDGLALLEGAKLAGVDIDAVRIMTMNYGSFYSTGDGGADAIAATEATLTQLASIGIDAPVVPIPMIGLNDVRPESFLLNDAQELVDYAKTNDNVAGLSMWSLSRDNGSVQGIVSPLGSGISQDEYAFSQIFNTVSETDMMI
ncbi:MAG: hypothetical protein AAGG47_01480 [Pseudomonadota bacterium]